MYSYSTRNRQQGINPGYYLVISLLFLLSCQKHHQPLPEYNKAYGGMKDDYGYSVVPARDGGFLIAGTTSSNNGDITGNHGYADVCVVKLDADGNKIWQKAFGGSGNDMAFSVITAADGGFAIAGTTNSNDGDISGNHSNNYDAWIIKIDAAGKLLWQKTFGGSDADGARSIVETVDGGFAVAGYANSKNGTVSGNNGKSDAWVLKLSGIGNLLWQQVFGGTGDDFANSVIALADGGIAIAGQTTGLSVDMFIARMSEAGNVISKRTLGGSRYDQAMGIVATSDSGFVVAGSTCSKDGNMGATHDTSGKTSDLCLAKLDPDLKMVWIKAFGGSGNDSASSVVATPDGGFLVAGQTNSRNGDVSVWRGGTDAWVLKVDSRGNKLWQQSVGGSGNDAAYAITAIPKRGYVMVGASSSHDGDVLFNRGGYDILTATFKND